MISKQQVERYPLEASPFFRMGRGVDLAQLLHVTPKELTRLIVQRPALYWFKERQIGEKSRSLAVPTGIMRDVHERIKDLLGRIILNEYLYSPRRGKAPVDNAEAHLGAKVVVKLDIRQFYPSTTAEHVFQFFHHRLKMVEDVAGRLTKLCTINGKIPFGSPLSPILCALVHDDIFSSAASKLTLDGATMSLWVDDLTASGEHVRHSIMRDIKRLVESKRLTTHKAFRTTVRRGLVVTGAFVDGNGVAPGNKAHEKMRDALNLLNETSDPSKRAIIAQSLIGRTHNFLQIYRGNSEMCERLKSRLAWLHSVRRASLEGPESQFDAFAPSDEPPPWV